MTIIFWVKNMRYHRWFLVLPFLFGSLIINAAPQPPIEQKANIEILSIYHQLQQIQPSSMTERLNIVSQNFLGKPYFLGALGEGIEGRYDQFPLYRTDLVDCLTFVETVLAIALTQDHDQFIPRLKQIRYQKGHVSFITRNHFTELDWNTNIQALGILKDITRSFHNEHGQPVYKIAHATIDKANWYQHFTLPRIRLISSNPNEQEKRLRSLKALGKQLIPQEASIPYIPFNALFDATGKPRQYLFQQIPNGSIVEIIRPNWNLKDVIGTNLNVSHLGFVFKHHGKLIFRNASSIKGKVVDQPLIEYLQNARQSPTIRGINIQVIRPQS